MPISAKSQSPEGYRQHKQNANIVMLPMAIARAGRCIQWGSRKAFHSEVPSGECLVGWKRTSAPSEITDRITSALDRPRYARCWPRKPLCKHAHIFTERRGARRSHASHEGDETAAISDGVNCGSRIRLDIELIPPSFARLRQMASMRCSPAS